MNRQPSSNSSPIFRQTPTTSFTSRTAAGFLPTVISARRCSSTGTGRRATRRTARTSLTPASARATRPTTGRVIIATENRVKPRGRFPASRRTLTSAAIPEVFPARPTAWNWAGIIIWRASTAASFITAAPAMNVSAPSSRNPMPAGMWIPSSPPIGRRQHSADGVHSQRHPWNPGGTNFGVQYGYKSHGGAKFRLLDLDLRLRRFEHNKRQPAVPRERHESAGERPVQIYAGGPLTGAWQTSNMTQRVTNAVSVTPQYIADYYYTKVSGHLERVRGLTMSARPTRAAIQ